MEKLLLNTNSNNTYHYKLVASFLIILMLWWSIPKWLIGFPEIAFADSSIWHLILLGVLLWLLTHYLSGYLFRQTLVALGLPRIQILSSQFNTLTLWQKYIIYVALFISWWLGMLISMVAIL